MTPLRIQRKRTAGWRMPPNTVNVTRPSIFGNPIPVECYGQEGAVDRFRRLVSGQMSTREMSESSTCCGELSLVTVRHTILGGIGRLRGKNLMCWCGLCPKHISGKPLGIVCNDCKPCHADVLLELSNA